MGSSSAEWWHLAELWSKKYSVLLFDRPGYGQSTISERDRTPENIALELDDLVQKLEIKNFILIGHSLGGLYAYQYVKMFPGKVKSLILVDPVSPDNIRFKKELTKNEYAKSGVDKSANLRMGLIICSLGIGWLFKSRLKKAPPFYYYHDFSKEAENYILKNSTNKQMYRTSLEEYSFLENQSIIDNLSIKVDQFKLSLFLILHTPEVMKKEIEYYGNTDRTTASKIENIWLDIMKKYLILTKNSRLIQAKNSSHFIHLSDPDSIWGAIENAASVPNNA
jgi:pimeloyl-ACP methyl ester carboxylesterase